MKVNHYGVLGLTQDCSEADVTRAYRILAKRFHPDRNKSSKKSHEQFVTLQEAYETLKDPKKRKIYDLTGDCAEGAVSESVINPEDIELFAQTYPGSAEEREDVIDFYRRFDGDVNQLFDFIPTSTPTDECFDRLMNHIVEAISAREISAGNQSFERSRMQLKRKLPRLRGKLRRENDEHKREHGDMSFAELAAKIKSNQNKRRQAFDNELLQLTDQQAPKKRKSKSARTKKSL